MSNSSSSSWNGNAELMCYVPTMIASMGVWQGGNPFEFSLPLFFVQLTLVVVTTRTLIFILKPLHQPRFVAEILGGMILGPMILGRFTKFTHDVFAYRSIPALEAMANVGLQYFLFLVGLEMDLSVIKRAGRKGISIAIGGMILPFLIGCGLSIFLHGDGTKIGREATYHLFLGTSLAVTSFPILARILVDAKLINTEIGQMAMASAIFNDISAWILLAFSIALSGTNTSYVVSLCVIISNIAFVVVCFFIIRPIIMLIIQRTPEGEPISELDLSIILTGVMVSGFTTETLGTHFTIGSFVFGLMIPNETLGIHLIEKLEDIVSGILVPLFYTINGLKLSLSTVTGYQFWNLFIMIAFAYIGKLVGTATVSHFYNLPFHEGITLGLLMNTKGLVEVIILHVGRDLEVLDEGTFSVAVIAVVLMTGMVGPMLISIHRSTRRFVVYKRRTIQSAKHDSELRILCCIHTSKSVPTMINLLEATHPTKRSPLYIYVLHLIELTGRASAMLIVHNTKKSTSRSRGLTQSQAESDHIFHAFENYQQQEQTCVTIQPLTAISPFFSMHEDICSLAEDKRVAFIILPFHKHQTVDGCMESTNAAFQRINESVMANAPCSIGILLDRGLNGSSTSLGLREVSHNVVVLFFGGPDDREALAYAWRMSDHPRISLTVLRLLPIASHSHNGFTDAPSHGQEHIEFLSVVTDAKDEKRFDEEYIKEFKEKTSHNESITYVEKFVNNGEETIAMIRSVDSMHDLYIVGKGQGMSSTLIPSLTEWSECPELGAIGDLLASSDFGSSASVLVVQHYIGSEGTHIKE